MALDELHARRLETVAAVMETALDRIELVLRSAETEEGTPRAGAPFTSQQIREARQEIAQIRRRLGEGLERFSIPQRKMDPRQLLAAELSALWVVLENALPKRLKGYGRVFDPADRAEWEKLIRDLLGELERLRALAIGRDAKSPPAPHTSAPRKT
jgi:ribosomal protein L29